MATPVFVSGHWSLPPELLELLTSSAACIAQKSLRIWWYTRGFAVSTRSCLCSCYRTFCNHPCPCRSSCLCNRCHCSCNHPGPYTRFVPCNRAYLSGHLPESAEKRPL